MTTSRYALARAILRVIEPAGQRDHVGSKRLLLAGIESAKRLDHWPVIGAEHLEPMLRAAIAKYEHARLGPDLAVIAKQLVRPGARAPDSRRFNTRARRQMRDGTLPVDLKMREPVVEAQQWRPLTRCHIRDADA